MVDVPVVTIAEAARMLGVTEHWITTRVKRGEVGVARYEGGNRRKMLVREDVEILALRNAHHAMPWSFRHVLIVTTWYDRGMADLAHTALRAAGLQPTRHATVLEAISASQIGDVAIIVLVGTPTVQDLRLIDTFGDEVRVVRMEHPEGVRPVVREAWHHVRERIEHSRNNAG